MLGHVLGVGVFEHIGSHHLLLGVGGVKRSREFLNLLEIGGAGKNHEGVGVVAGRDFDEFLGLLAGQFLEKRLDLLGQFLGVDMLQVDRPQNDILVFCNVQGRDQPGGGGQIVVVIGYDHQIGPLV